MHVLLTGESVPSMVVLWVMRELPPRSRDNSMKGRTIAQEVLVEDALVPDPTYLSQLLSSAAGRRYLLLPNCCNSDVSPSWRGVRSSSFYIILKCTVLLAVPSLVRRLKNIWINVTSDLLFVGRLQIWTTTGFESPCTQLSLYNPMASTRIQ
jgi:hypothetical protein